MTQENKVAELMKARVKCIGTDDKHYPGSPFKIGEILLVDSAGDRSAIGLSRNERGESYWLIPKDYPHLFKKLEWWEDREVSEMPEHIKYKHTGNGQGWVFKKVDGQFFITKAWADKGLLELLPATQSEYYQYIKQKAMSDKVAEIPQDVKDKIKQKATELIATHTGKVRFKDGAEFGYGLAQQEIASFHKQLQDSLLLYQNQVATIETKDKELAEAKNAIEILTNTLSVVMENRKEPF